MSVTLPIIQDTRQRDLAAAPGQIAFPWPLPLIDAADLVVYTRTESASYFTRVTTGYTVTLASNRQSATVTFAVAPRGLAGDPPVTVRLAGARVAGRTTDVTRSGAISSADLERELDRITMINQELRRDLNRLMYGGLLGLEYFDTSAVTGYVSAKSGANSDITSLAGLTTPLSLAQGGTGANSAAAARTSLGLGAAATVNVTSTLNNAAIGKAPIFANVLGQPTLFSSGSVYFLATGASTDTMNYYFQRAANYTGGAAGDGSAPVLSAIRAETTVADTVTYAVEIGGIFMTQNYSRLSQGVGVCGQATSYHGGRVWGGVFEGHEYPEIFTALAGQTTFTIPGGYTANTAVGYKNGVLLTRGVHYTDTSGTQIVLTTAATAGDVYTWWRGIPKSGVAYIGSETNVMTGPGADTANPVSGNRIVAALIPKRQDPTINLMHNVGSALMISTVGDPWLTIDRGVGMYGQITTGIDLSQATIGSWHMLWLTAGSLAGITAAGNLTLGNLGTFDYPNTATLLVGRTAAGGMIRVGDGTHWGRFGASSGGGVVFGAETNIDVLFTRNGSELIRLLAAGKGLQMKYSGALGTSYANDAAAAADGVVVGQLYRNGSTLQVRVA